MKQPKYPALCYSQFAKAIPVSGRLKASEQVFIINGLGCGRLARTDRLYCNKGPPPGGPFSSF